MSSVSVVVPCYNYAHFLPTCVDSVLSQPGVDVRVLVVDDASTDDTPAVAARLAERDPRVEVLRHRVNQGHIATYNDGLARATGDYTLLLSADDLLVPGALRRACRLLDAHPEVGLVYGRSVFYSSGGPLPPARTSAGRYRIWPGREWLRERCRAGHNCVSSPEVVVRTALQHRLGGYRADLPHAGDLEMWMRFAAHADVGHVRGADQAYYRVHPDSMMRKRFGTTIADIAQRKAAFDAVFDAHGSSVRDAQALRALAHRTLAREALWTARRGRDRGRLDAAQAAELVEFALAAAPEAARMPEYAHARAGRRAAGWSPSFLTLAVMHRGRGWLGWQRWKRFGV